MSAGFTLALLMIGSIREVLGSGSLFGVALFGEHFEPWGVMVLPPGGFLTMGVLLMVFAWYKKRQQTRAAHQLAVPATGRIG
jgi:electron transport complex protein RnfE